MPHPDHNQSLLHLLCGQQEIINGFVTLRADRSLIFLIGAH